MVRLHTVLMDTHSFYPCLDAWRLTGGARELFYVSAYPAHVADVVMTHAPGHVVTVTYAVWFWHGPEAFEGGWDTGVAILHGYGPRATRGSVDLPRLGRPRTRARAPAFASCCLAPPTQPTIVEEGARTRSPSHERLGYDTDRTPRIRLHSYASLG